MSGAQCAQYIDLIFEKKTPSLDAGLEVWSCQSYVLTPFYMFFTDFLDDFLDDEGRYSYFVSANLTAASLGGVDGAEDGPNYGAHLCHGG